jgi:3-oxoadipate enol-lactonase
MPYVRTRLGRWFYEERGPSARGGDAVLLWHSLLCDGGMWRNQLEPLSALGRVVSFDGPGHGKSEVPPRHFTLEDNADALLDAFEELGVQRVVVCGLSWGGMVGMRLALRHPHRVKALALLDTSAEETERAEKVKYRMFVSFGRRFGMPRLLTDSQIAPLFFSARTRAEQPEMVERMVRAASGFDREGVARASLAVVVHRTNVLPDLGAIRVPTIVVCGREDRATPPIHSQRIAEKVPGARLVWIDGAGHLSTLEKPTEVNGALVPFVKAAMA